MLILKIAALRPVHGYGISQRIRQISKEVLRVQQGSLYPALHRLENEAGWKPIAVSLTTADRPSFTDYPRRGSRQLGKEESSWRRLAGAVTQILETAS